MRRKEIQGLGVVLAFVLLVAGCGNDGSVSNSGDAGGTEAAADSTGPCGDLSQTCCANDTCNAGLACGLFPGSVLPRCFHCGNTGEPCCVAAPWCMDGLVCSAPLAPARENVLSFDIGRCYEARDGSACFINDCLQPGGQYCGVIFDCGKRLNCGECSQPGFTCGGTGVYGLCGAAADSGACNSTVCETPSGKYCGRVGDGCGSSVDCGACSGDVTCGGSGVPNVCGEPPDSDLPRDPPPPLPPRPPPPPNLP